MHRRLTCRGVVALAVGYTVALNMVLPLLPAFAPAAEAGATAFAQICGSGHSDERLGADLPSGLGRIVLLDWRARCRTALQPVSLPSVPAASSCSLPALRRCCVNARRTPDPNRAEKTVTGTYFGPFARALSGSARTQGVKPESPGHASARPVCDIDLAQLPYAPCNGGRILRLKTGVLYAISEMRPDGTGRADLDLNQLSC
jgi:hypothetical protein